MLGVEQSESLLSAPQLQCASTPLNMTFLRRHRLVTVFFALVSLLFMQLAVAGYVCPNEGMSGAAESNTAMAHAGMPCAESMVAGIDASQPGLCQAHCQSDQQSASTYVLPVLPEMPAMTPDFSKLGTSLVSQGVPLQAPLLLRTTAPPLSVRNCCFRT